MIGGVALLGTVTVTLASWLVRALREETDESAQIDALQAELVRFAALIESHDPAPPGRG